IVLQEALQLALVLDSDVREGAGEILQDRIEPGLRTRPPPFRAEVRIRSAAKVSNADAAELVSRHAGDERGIERPIVGEAPVADLVGNSQLPAELHRPDTDLQHLGGADLVRPFFDDKRVHASPAEIGGQSEANRAGPGYKNVDVVHRVIEVSGLLLAWRAIISALKFNAPATDVSIPRQFLSDIGNAQHVGGAGRA